MSDHRYDPEKTLRAGYVQELRATIAQQAAEIERLQKQLAEQEQDPDDTPLLPTKTVGTVLVKPGETRPAPMMPVDWGEDNDCDCAALRERVAELEGVVGKLPKLAGGEPAIAGGVVYVARDPGEDTAVEMDTLVIGPETFDGFGLDRCHSTAEAARAAAEQQP